MNIDGVEYNLSNFRTWLVKHHRDIVDSHFVKAITMGKRTTFFHDWQHIYFLASELLITKQYTNELNSSSIKPISDRGQSNQERG
jgi:hypothetical protein